jgi:hypothetical protein
LKTFVLNFISKILLFFIIVFVSNQLALGQTVQTETSQAGWVTTGLAPYTSGTWTDNTAGGATGRYPTTTSFKMMYITTGNAGISPGTYNLDVRWYDNTAETTSILYLQVGRRTCSGTSTTVCNTGSLDVDDTWLLDITAGTFATRTYTNLTITAGDTIFYYIKQNGGSPRGYIDYLQFTPYVVNASNPVIANQTTPCVSEGAAIGTNVYTVVASDPDAGQSVTAYTITGGNTGGAFAIDNTGKITVNAALNSAISPYVLVVQA